jgi:putative RNA 2'-phosphotransferase
MYFAQLNKMDEKRLVRLSKFISKHLRHEPDALGLTLQVGGWVPIKDLLRGAEARGVKFSFDELREVVITNDKQRYSFDETGTLIRANQGHSTPVDLQLESAEPPAVLYHGTGAQSVKPIMELGLLPMARHHVHLSMDVETALKVGARHGKPTVLVVDAAQMHEQGTMFFRSDNGVWLTAEVPPRFLKVLKG